MGVRVIDNTPVVKETLNQKSSLFLRIIAEEIVALSTRSTPMKTGALRRDVLKQVLGLHGQVVWAKDYARYQEDKQFKNYTTPGTGPHFAESAVTKVVDGTAIIATRAGLI